MGASGNPFYVSELQFLTPGREYLPGLVPSVVWGREEAAGGEALPDCGIQSKRKGVVLSPLLVITIIIMEISEQAPEASPFISSPTPAFCLGSGMWGPSGCPSLSFAEAARLGRRRGSRGAPRPPVEASRLVPVLSGTASPALGALKSNSQRGWIRKPQQRPDLSKLTLSRGKEGGGLVRGLRAAPYPSRRGP